MSREGEEAMERALYERGNMLFGRLGVLQGIYDELREHPPVMRLVVTLLYGETADELNTVHGADVCRLIQDSA